MVTLEDSVSTSIGCISQTDTRTTNSAQVRHSVAEALNFAAPSITRLAGFAVQVVQAMYLVDGNDLEA